MIISLDLSDSGLVSVSEDDFSEDVLNVLDGAKKLFQYDASRRQATSIIMLAVIGSEFQKDHGALTNTKTEKPSNDLHRKVGFQGSLPLYDLHCWCIPPCMVSKPEQFQTNNLSSESEY